MTTNSDLVGFDIRWARSKPLLDLWPDQRREQFLLRPDVLIPLSVDRGAWPSRFKLEAGADPFAGQSGDVIRIEPGLTGPHFQLFDLWDSLSRMLGQYRPIDPADCGIGVGLLRPEHYPEGAGFDAGEWWRAIHGTPINPPQPEPAWTVLGYDVANSGFNSAVSNCGMLDEERPALRAAWGPRINPFGVFGTVEDAVAFCTDANQRLADNGPFYVMELFLIWDHFPAPDLPEKP
jgi:hypothetical protein